MTKPSCAARSGWARDRRHQQPQPQDAESGPCDDRAARADGAEGPRARRGIGHSGPKRRRAAERSCRRLSRRLLADAGRRSGASGARARLRPSEGVRAHRPA
jgi:hypothetical protein